MCFASGVNLIFKNILYVGTSGESIAQWQLASLCGLYCVHGLRVSSLCHIARCQGQLVTMYGFRSGGSNGSFFHPSFSFYLSS